jgi:Ser/Thr protein kinase RdoA (MazF antagonist)
MKSTSKDEYKEYLKVAEGALMEYCISYDSISFLQQSENITFCAEKNGNQEKYLIRIHKSINQDNDEYQSNKSLINSELLLLDKLNSCEGIKAQVPIKNKWGSYVTQIFSEILNKELNITILKWVHGQVIDINEKEYEGLAYTLGEEMAKMHKSLSQWKSPQEFVRREYDLIFMKNNVRRLEKLVDIKIISKKTYHYIYDKCIEIIEFIDRNLPKEGNWGLIHADLNEGNYVVNGKNIFFIDFSMSGLGYYLSDIAQTLMHLNIENRRLFIRGYENSFVLPNNYERLIEAFFILAIIDNMLFLSSNEEEHEHVSKVVNYLSSHGIKKYENNIRFIFGVE